jgi:hypothetical protein
VNRTTLMVIAWAWVGIPFAYGVYQLILNVVKIFKG